MNLNKQKTCFNSMATLKDYKLVRQKYKDLINGYILRIQRLLSFEENSYFNIPVSINHLCAVYYKNRGAFNTKLGSENLKFIDDEIVQKINDENFALCLFGEPITDATCKVFRIEYKIISRNSEFCPHFGFAASSSSSILIVESFICLAMI